MDVARADGRSLDVDEHLTPLERGRERRRFDLERLRRLGHRRMLVHHVESPDLGKLDLVVGALDHAVSLDDFIDAVGLEGFTPGAHPRLESRRVRFLLER